MDAQAERSLERLAPAERDAARVLVELEDASRDRDAARLTRLFHGLGGSLEECERAFEQMMERERMLALEVRHVALRGASAVAGAKVTLAGAGGERRTALYTFRLVARDGAWLIRFET